MKTLPKTLILIAILTTMFCACKKDNSGGDSLTGKWKMVQSKVGIAGPGQWVTVPDDKSTYVQFDANGKLEGTAFVGYTTYTVKDSVTLVFTKPDNTVENYRYSISNELLDLSPAGPILCTEGCTYRFGRF